MFTPGSQRRGWALLICLLERSSGRRSPERRARVLRQPGAANRCCFPLPAFVNYQRWKRFDGNPHEVSTH